MTRLDIIKTIGEQYLVSNIENGEFSYAKALQEGEEGSLVCCPFSAILLE
ncbi:hypothetical protein [Porphyromonas levii]|nr:hypothetical protein [Porphyromonas levii]MBR8712279.1 hypothetical protein [Porphyromonas levii]MBR8714254.1 hypothetical protein [Porphyromonas levii]MBR8726796.1 hypothetical protein [Porphyromonas levii]MBR8735102.1 hypothetical protein [Porphyromonas levii]MBR8759012.1 hypothetical protein [Porphyromonas levii]